jgi:hypothetical protein
MNPQLRAKISESLSAVLPITAIVLAISIFIVPIDIGTFSMFLSGAVLLIVGMGMFQLGAETAMTPLGEGIGVGVTKSKKIPIILAVSFALGVIITVAEPDLQVLAQQVPSIDNLTLILTVGVGVGIFLSLAVLRIVFKISLSVLLIILYGIVILLAFFIPDNFRAVAFDSGGVTTGPITVPFIMALGVGLSSIRSDKDASSDSFGLVSLASVGPIIAVMCLGLFFPVNEIASESADIIAVGTVKEVAFSFVSNIPHYLKEVFISILPLVAVYIIFQLATKRYPKRQRIRIFVGFIYTFIGLVLFLCGVNVGFAPVGTVLGRELATGNLKWLLVPIGMLIGYFIVKAEPAIQILNKQVQTVTEGSISARAMNRCLSVGVSVSLGLAMLRIILQIPVLYILIPGYLLALAMSLFVPKIFVGIAFDSGGVASGPMTSTFLLPLCIGACEALGGNVMTDAFGAVALVALTPLIAIQIMGVAYKIKLRSAAKNITAPAVIPADADDIIEL